MFNPVKGYMQLINDLYTWYTKRQCRKYNKHTWVKFSRLSRASVYYCRECIYCDRMEMNSSGPLGNGEWYSIDDHQWMWDWEKEDFKESKREL